MKKILLFVALATLLTLPLSAKKGIGFGMTLTTGPVWAWGGSGGTGIAGGSIADQLNMNIDLHLGADFHINKWFRVFVGAGLRPIVSKDGGYAEIYPLKVRLILGIFSVYAGLGLVAIEGNVAFSSNLGLGFIINIGSHFGIILDLIDTSIYAGDNGAAMTLNSLIGFNLYF